ncbi:hypothetical protein D3C75_1182760 [compost metagenome]
MKIKACSIPGCNHIAPATFGTLPVCVEHEHKLIQEADNYYERRIEERPLYGEIREKIKASIRSTFTGSEDMPVRWRRYCG